MGNLQQVKEYYERALDISLRKLGPEHIDVKRTSNMLGAVQNALKNLQATKEYDERASDIRLEELGLKHFDKKRRVYRNLDAALPPLEDLLRPKNIMNVLQTKDWKSFVLKMWITALVTFNHAVTLFNGELNHFHVSKNVRKDPKLHHWLTDGLIRLLWRYDWRHC